jgi:subtilisin family serine protease
MSSTQNITFVVAAGNDLIDASRFSPARVDSAITVGSYNNTITPNQISNFSNFGQCVDILSPGNRIFSTWLANGFRALNGTSMATPIVAGAIVNMLTVEAGNLTPQQIKQRLQDDAINSFQSRNNAEIRLPVQYRGDCPETNNICTFPPTFPYSVYVGKHTVTKIVQNY